MIETRTNQLNPATSLPVFRLKQAENDRMAGSIPTFGAAETPADIVAQDVAEASRQTTTKPNSFAAALSETTTSAGSTGQSPNNESDGTLGFKDFLDVINPLQHIPVIGTIYRAITGDEIKPAARIFGDAAYGGIIGASLAIADTIVQSATGKDASQHIAGLFHETKSEPSSQGSLSDLPGTTIALANLAARAPHYNE